jgi:DNA-directed RNA polymerase subunit alpha
MNATYDDIAELMRAGKLDEAESRLRGLAPDGEDEAIEKQFLEGFLLERRQEWEQAITMYYKVLEEDEEHTETLFRLAYLHDLHGADDEAMEFYERCVRQPSAHVNALMNLAVLYEDQGRYDEALELVSSVVDQYPNNVRARVFRADVESSLTMYYDEERERTREKHDALLDTLVSDFELSVRSRNCLKQMNINTLGDLLTVTEQKLLAYKNFGETSLNEIKAMLAQKGLRLGQALDEPDSIHPATPASGPPVAAGDPNLLNRSVAELELSVRSRKCLQRLGISTLNELTHRTEAELLAIKNFGQTSLVEIKRRLGELGLTLRNPGR